MLKTNTTWNMELSLSDPRSFGAKLGAQAFFGVENMGDFRNVVFSVEQFSEPVELDERADAQLGVRFRRPATDDESARDAFQNAFGEILRFRAR